VSRVRRGAANATIYGELRAAILIVEDLADADAILDDVMSVADVAIARDRLRLVRDRLFAAVRHDIDPLERLELELDRADV
jgi:uncharacterized protein YerC